MADETYTKADLDKAIKDAVEEATKGLKDNLNAALDEAKEAKRKLRSASEIKPEDLTAAEERADKAEARIKELEKQAKDATAAAEKATKALETESGFTQRLLIQDGLKSALIANGVKDEDFIDSLTAKFAGGAKVVIEGEERKAMYGDKPLGDFIKEWAGSDAGKKFTQAPINSGGLAPGGKGQNEGGKTITRPEFDAMSQPDRMKFSSDGGKVVDQAA